MTAVTQSPSGEIQMPSGDLNFLPKAPLSLDTKETLNPFTNALEQLDVAARYLELPPAIHAMLRRSERELTVHFPVKMDDGSIRIFEGHRVQYNSSRGPCKGGIRYAAGVNLDEVRALAMCDDVEMRDCQLIPFGGAKGGVVC